MGADAERRVFDAIAPDKDVDGFHPVNVGPLVQNRATLVAVHAVGRHRAARAIGHRHRRRARGGHRPQRHRRQADGAAAAAPPRDGDDLPFADAGSAGGRGGGRHPGRGDRPARLRHARTSSSRARRSSTSARRRSPIARWSSGCSPAGSKRREAFERRGSLVVGDVHPEVARGGRRADAGAGRRRPADDRDAAEEHARGGAGARRPVGQDGHGLTT